MRSLLCAVCPSNASHDGDSALNALAPVHGFDPTYAHTTG
jgi:hypothetical protein